MRLCRSLRELDIQLLLGMFDDDIKHKLNGIPHIRYLNLDERVDKKDYIERQFEKYNITNYVRISANRYHSTKYNEWKKFFFVKEMQNQIERISTLINQFQSIIDWYDQNISETCLIAEDDISFYTAKFWPFDWSYLLSNLPYNWDCVQFHVIGESFIPMGLTRRTRNNHSAACYLINRQFASKLKNIYYINSKFKFHDNYGYGKNWPIYHYQSADFVPYEIGLTYSFPIFITNSNFLSNSYNNSVNYMAKKSDSVVLNWWKNESYKFTLLELFSLDTSKRNQLIVSVNYN